MTITLDLKEQAVAKLNLLPEGFLREVVIFLDFLQYRLEQGLSPQTPYKPVALGGLWEGVVISDEDIDQARREMWGGFGEREL